MITLTSTYKAIGPGFRSSFLASGGTSPYSYSVLPDGAGGSIDSDGWYTAPTTVSENPLKLYDTIQVVDASSDTATAQILVGTPLLLFCDILQTEMGLSNGRVYLYNQKIFQPADYGLYIVVSIARCKPFGNTTSYDGSGSGLVATQSVNMLATLDLDIMSRGPAARDQKELVIAALNSVYSQQQQTANSFTVSTISNEFLNLSFVDGAAIPYRFRISCNIIYFVRKTGLVQYYNTFTNPPSVVIDA